MKRRRATVQLSGPRNNATVAELCTNILLHLVPKLHNGKQMVKHMFSHGFCPTTTHMFGHISASQALGIPHLRRTQRGLRFVWVVICVFACERALFVVWAAVCVCTRVRALRFVWVVICVCLRVNAHYLFYGPRYAYTHTHTHTYTHTHARTHTPTHIFPNAFEQICVMYRIS